MLRTNQLKPNPSGKDRSRLHIPPPQLHGEWVDIKNAGYGPLSLDGLELHHLAYPASGGKPEWRKVIGLLGVLGSGQVLRIHSGPTVPASSLMVADRTGADFHAFTGRHAYVWNNDKGDTAALWRPSTSSWVDKASYDPYPPEGVILVRSGDKLLPLTHSVRQY